MQIYQKKGVCMGIAMENLYICVGINLKKQTKYEQP